MLDAIRRLFDFNLVQFVPGLRFFTVFGPRLQDWNDLLPQDAGRILTYSGSAALFRAGQVLNLRSGDVVLVPDYNCGHEFEPLLRLGAAVRIFPVDEGLQPDMTALRQEAVENVRALLVTHYFGFPQDLVEIRAFCSERGIYLIEDCAHVLQSRPRVGITGDVAVFSFRKTLPLPNGGALVINNPSLATPKQPAPPPALNGLSKLLDLLRKSCLRPGTLLGSVGRRIVLLLLCPLLAVHWLLVRLDMPNALNWFDPDDEDLDFDDSVLHWGMSPVSEGILLRTDIARVIEKRRHNFLHLLTRLRDLPFCEPLFEALPKDACPMCFPVILKDRESTYQALAARGVSSGIWWETFHPALNWFDGQGGRLKRHVLALPIHQELGRRQLDRMVRKLGQVTSGKPQISPRFSQV